jgi:hypothetical protein
VDDAGKLPECPIVAFQVLGNPATNHVMFRIQKPMFLDLVALLNVDGRVAGRAEKAGNEGC